MVENQQTSPRPMVKVTYLERQKRNSTDVNDFTEASSEGKPHNDTKKPSTRGTTIQEGKDSFRVPDPPSRRLLDESHESIKSKPSPSSSKDRKLTHLRSSSITSLSRVAQQVAASPSNKKPPSVVGKVETPARSNTPETEFDDNASIAESAISISRIRRSEAERIQYFENQPECGKFESHRAFCSRCGKYISLGTKRTYTVRPWEKHRARCDQKTPSGSMAKLETDGVDGASAMEGTGRRTEAERKALLEADERAEIVEPDRVKCRKCQKWVRLLAGNSKYSLQNWNKHQLSCGGDIPSDRVAAAERKLRIVNDAQVKAFDPDSIDCLFCGKHIVLEGEGDYNLMKWEEHKQQCSSDTKADSSPVPFPSSSEPVLSAPTDIKLIASEGTPPASNTANLKRGREEDDLATDDVDARPSIRPRDETYRAPNREAPSPLGWFMLPFKAFVRGFRESLKGESSS